MATRPARKNVNRRRGRDEKWKMLLATFAFNVGILILYMYVSHVTGLKYALQGYVSTAVAWFRGRIIVVDFSVDR